MSFELDALKTKCANQELEIGKLRGLNQELRDLVESLKTQAIKEPETIIKTVTKPVYVEQKLIEKEVVRIERVETIKTVNVPIDREVIKEVPRIVIEEVPDLDSIEKLRKLQAKYDKLKETFDRLIVRVQ